MPRLFHRPPKYCLHKGTKQATVSLFGKRIYLGPYGSSRSHEAYQQVLRQWHDAKDQQSTTKPETAMDDDHDVKSVTAATLRAKRLAGSPVTINELALVFRRHARQYYRKNGKITREATLIDDVIRILRKHHATDFLHDFGPVNLDSLRERMIDDLDWSRMHINKQVGRLIRMFKWAAEKELVDPSVPLALKSLAGLKKGRTRARETAGVRCVADSAVEQTLPKLPEIVADMVRLQRLTGARPGEVCSLRPCDLDQSSDVWIYTPEEHKTEHHEKNRVIAIGPKAQALLTPYLDRKADSFCFSPAESERQRRAKAAAARTTPASCGNRRGTNRRNSPKRSPRDRYFTDSYRRAIHRACDKLGIEKWAPNRLRHTSATQIRKEFGIEAAQVICGHEKADVTQVYAERDLELAKDVARKVG
ncbi:site-specific tyrosine recombinase XerC [Crateriforma conspicua]|uniref:Site-specific tyrosine recombinase XerC n=1 Tax=Crateriforma conspicua TaxID=2527996 RepID=A0A5C6FJE8_9PLAN|nr:site-specific integrase [Crateriforma conspicua]TWU62375.1 site-specific tyrosine recombinase XerC [Crateriforma conspicua]